MSQPLNFVFDYFFPSFILPNATMPELTMINYMVSLHSNKAQGATVFEQGISLPEMFGQDFGGV